MVALRTVSYKVHHTEGSAFDLDDEHLAALLGTRPVLMVADDAVWSAHSNKIGAYLQRRLNSRGVIPIPGTEATKSLAFAAALCQAALDARIPRDGALIAVGGGTIMDVVGFAASIFRRGIGYVRVPTTLIGMIDVGVGIKQAVNVDRKKNIIGSFYAPLGIVNDQTFLATLPRHHLACGVAEAIKVALVCDERLFALLEEYSSSLIATGFQQPVSITREILYRSEAVMIDQLSSDLHEMTRRRLVDFGHTFSPIIETMSDYAVPHGEAVAMDMLLSSVIGVRARLVPPWLPARLARLLRAIDLRLAHPTMTLELMNTAMDEARLHRAGRLNLVVPTAIGRGTFLQEVSSDDLGYALAEVRQLQAAG
jgi:3-dehydroquinate synthase